MLEALWLAGALVAAPIEELTVVARRRQPAAAAAVAVSAVAPEAAAGFTHPNQLFDAVPATWISRGSGQEHLTAIRSPVLTGAGACGAFLLMEDGLPIRPPGFCNVNNLFELGLSQAQRVEVLRGPAPAFYGSNGLHGAINVVPAEPAAGDPPRLTAWLGPDRHRRLLGAWSGASGGGALRFETDLLSTASFRAGEGVDQQKVRLNWLGEWGGRAAGVSFSATNLNQETAGFIFGENAYRDPGLRRGNVNPEAFRDARSARLSAKLEWQPGAWTHRLRPFVRSSDMAFLQHFLPGQPLETNGQDSLGLQWSMTRDSAAHSIDVGVDLDLAEGDLRQFQGGPTRGSSFLRETRPPGLHYDFEARAVTAAAFVHHERHFGKGWRLDLGLRAESTRYRYDNRASDGNLRDDGTACGFGGCLYQRPADRSDRFTDVAPKLALSRRIGSGQRAFFRLSRGFRAPQANELYRLQRGQSVASLDSEKADSAELGWRAVTAQGSLELGLWYLSKRNFIFRDADGFNVSDGRTRHRGFEWRWQHALGERWSIDQAASYSRHHYAFLRNAGGGEQIAPGNQVDTAPKWLGRTALGWAGNEWSAALEWVHQGGYPLEAANRYRYGGHDLFHLDARRGWGAWRVAVRLENLTNARYAERADFAFGQFRYFPGAGRQLFVSLSWQPQPD